MNELTRRLTKEKIKLSKAWAMIHRNIEVGEKLDIYVKSLRRCDRLQTALQNSLGGKAV
tara:strand:- start:261 stop:437 length:177 start_codon:yes stop_codon:yes gene_type:complete